MAGTWRAPARSRSTAGPAPRHCRMILAASRTAAAERRPIVIFPQGTRVGPGTAAPYQPGVYALYHALSLPLVPAAVNSGLFWARRSFLKRPGDVTLEFLEPIPPGWPRRRLMEELEQRIETATAATRTGGQGRTVRDRSGDVHGWGRGAGNQSSSPPMMICSSVYGQAAGKRPVKPGKSRSSRRISLSADL